MKWIIRIVLLFVVIVAVVYGVGWLLPVDHVASSTAAVAASPQQVYDTIADVGTYSQWWSEIERVEMLPSADGRVRFRQHTGAGPIAMQVEESVPPSRFVTRIDDPEQPFGGTWTFEIAPQGDARSLVTITERGQVYDPLFRFMSRFVFGHTSTMESCLAALTTKFGG
jgi:uncharacterized protein YndB with AHSA1/START domain